VQQLEQRVAWITGAASGIGLAIAHRLADEKMKLVLVDVEDGALSDAERALRAKGANVLALRVDVSNGDAMAAAVARARDAFGIIHVICNNAGVGGSGGPMWLLSEADWRWPVDVNLWGVIHGIRLLVPQLLASGEEGHVINTASIAGLTSPPFMAPYAATKHAVVAISECLAKELELTKAKVGVSVVCPGFVKTRIASSQRNRPDRPSSATDAAASRFGAALEQLVAAGIAPERVADHVAAAIRANKFYVLTHPEMTPGVEHRMRQIIEEKPPGIDPVMRSLLGG